MQPLITSEQLINELSRLNGLWSQDQRALSLIPLHHIDYELFKVSE